MRQSISENIYVNLLAVLYFVTAAAAAALLTGVTRIIEALGRVDHNNFAVNYKAFEMGFAALFEFDVVYIENAVKDWMT